MQLITVEEMMKKILKDHQIDITGMNLNTIIRMAKPYIFDFEYPTVTPEYKELFETQFLRKNLRNYLCYTMEELDYWNMDLEYCLNLIMPYYNQLIESEGWFDKYISNPANNTDYKEIYTRTINGTQTETGNSTTSGAERSTGISNATTTSNDSLNSTSNTSTTGETKNTENDSETNTTQSTSESSSTGTGNTTETSTSNTKSGTDGNDKTVDNDLPKSVLDFEDYASAIGLTTSKQTTTTDNTTTGTNEVTQTTTGTTKENGSATKTSEITTNETTSTTGKVETSQTNEGKTISDNTTNSDRATSETLKSDNNTTNNQTETYEFQRVGNIGVQTPGEVFASTRKAFINTMDMILKDKEVTTLFLGVY